MLMLYFFSTLFLPLSLSLSVSIRRQRAQEVQPKSKPGAFFQGLLFDERD
jgi:hypothetical protein